jgi:AcrR family transcriptional regulator
MCTGPPWGYTVRPPQDIHLVPRPHILHNDVQDIRLIDVPTSAARSPRRDATENRAALLDAARLVLNKHPDASLEAIAAGADLSRRAVYGHFASRDDLLRELVSLGSRRVATSLASITHPDPVVRLTLIASRLWHEVEDIRVMAVFTVRGALKQHTDDALRPLRRMVLDTIGEAAGGGAIRDDIAPDRLARLMEDAMFAVLEEATEHPLPEEEGHRLVMLAVLGAVGLGWRDARAFIDSHAELSWTAERS